MYLGRIVELGPAKRIYADPKHPYTVSLLKAIPEPDPSRSVPRDLPRGEVPDAVAPPLGCPFHPRCLKAFEVCGWEGRDLRTLLEDRWTKLPEDRYEAERELIGDLDSLDEPSGVARLEASSGHSAAEVLELIERWRAEAPDDPFWKGVASVDADGDAVVVRFREGLVPRELEIEGGTVQCHLYDEEALAKAR
jgi:oligopeptide/dipeptide ABC transporter ATP-binding protein